jgi:drug/metabolite transporter (DMT)-like permease
MVRCGNQMVLTLVLAAFLLFALIQQVLGESLDPIKLLGCAIGIGGVFLYSIIDNIFPPAPEKKAE